MRIWLQKSEINDYILNLLQNDIVRKLERCKDEETPDKVIWLAKGNLVKFESL